MSKQSKTILIILFILLLFVVAIISFRTSYYDVTHYLSVQDQDLGTNEKHDFPLYYLIETFEQGTIETVEYNITVKGEEITKTANVYIPYGYDANKKYDVVYLMHGRGGKYSTWLGSNDKPKDFKHILDNMIENKDIRPVIVVTPGLTYAYGDKDTKDRDETSDDEVVTGTADEISDILIPLIDEHYSTYKSREHRLMAGFSMGGSLTWHMLMEHTKDFYYYIPMSMAIYFDDAGYSKLKSLESVRKIDEELIETGYTQNDFKVYVATGDEDHKSVAAYMMVKDLIEHTSMFTYADPEFKTGNIYLTVWSGRWHTYKQSYSYMYSGLKTFLKPLD